MIIWFAMAVPIVTAIVLYFWYQHRTLWWEFLLPFAVSVVLIATCKLLTETAQTRDTEYWGGWMTNAEYYEEWNERVSCRHPKYETRTDSQGHTYSEFVGYEHLYDVDYHAPYWQIHDSNNLTIRVNKATFEGLASNFGNRKFHDLRRSYHTIDGDKYVTTWSGNDDTLVPVTTTHSYENRVQASDSIFDFQEVDPEDYGLFDYPKVRGYYQCSSILGEGGPTQAQAEKILGLTNAKLGRRKQIRIWLLVFSNQPLQAGFDQENYWKGGNKNEFILTIGVDKDHRVQWCHPISWTEVETLKIEARNCVLEQKGQPVNLVEIAQWLSRECDRQFIRKPFADFSYLSVDPPGWAVFLAFALTIAVNVGTSAWIVHNEYAEEF